MASTFTDLGIEKMATGENAGTWGTKTNANLSLIEQLTGGYLSLAVAGSGTTALSIRWCYRFCRSFKSIKIYRINLWK